MSNPTNNGPTNKSLWDNDRRYDTARRAGAPSMANTPSARSLAPQVSNTNTTPQTPPGADSNNSSGGKRKKKRKLKKRRILLAILMLFVFLFVVGFHSSLCGLCAKGFAGLGRNHAVFRQDYFPL